MNGQVAITHGLHHGYVMRTIKELLNGNEFDFPVGYSLKSGGGKQIKRTGEQGALGM